MFSAVKFTGSCSPLRAVALTLLAVGLAGCSADVARFSTTAAHTSAASGSVSRGSSTGSASPRAAVPLPRPKPVLATKRRPIQVRLGNPFVRLGAPKRGPIPISARHRKESGPIARSKNNGRPRQARSRRGASEARLSPAVRADKQAERRSADRAPDTRTIFDWPVHGKVIARFGRQPGGEKNEGIAIAVPEGTRIASADDGVVIYAGGGLKKFGNLVLVRHANDYVTAYAHARELQVKRGDQIKRGDVIGTSGQTGSVSAPQLYFEIRRNSAPVDPLPLLRARE